MPWLLWIGVLILAGGTLCGAAVSIGRDMQPLSRDLQLSVPASSFARAIGHELRSRGFDCPTLRDLVLIRDAPNAKVIRVVCDGVTAPDLAEIQVVVRGSGSFAATPRGSPSFDLRGSS